MLNVKPGVQQYHSTNFAQRLSVRPTMPSSNCWLTIFLTPMGSKEPSTIEMQVVKRLRIHLQRSHTKTLYEKFYLIKINYLINSVFKKITVPTRILINNFSVLQNDDIIFK